MKRQFLFLLSVGVFLTGSLVAVFSGSGQVTTPAKYTPPEINFKQFPIVDFAASSPSDESAKAVLARKSRKYNNKSVSEDKTAVYSEFKVRIQAVLKNT